MTEPIDNLKSGHGFSEGGEIPEDYYLKPIEPEDNLPSYKQIETKLAYANHDIKSLREQLAKERELRKELVSSLTYIVKTLGALTLPQDEPEALSYNEALKAIQKAKDYEA